VPELIGVLKRGPDGAVVWRYRGRVLRREGASLTLEALFDRPDTPFMGVVLKPGDRFVETFYSDRWYNVFEIYDRDDGRLKGWYCNIGRPAELEPESVSYVDLALDLWVTPDGRQSVLDEDEFASLAIDDETRARARDALRELQSLFEKQRPPF
jgi:predicted RNA-binding protein associated with RNAse of E/G family